MEPDIENMTMNEYLEYEAVKEIQLWDDVRSRRSPTNNDEADVDSFHQNKNITVEDVERIRQFCKPNVPDVIENVIQPLIPKTLHKTPPNKDYVAPATKSILDDLLEEFGDKILNVTMVNEGEKCNPTKDLEELERLLSKEPQSNFTEIRVHSVIINTEPFIHTQLMSPLYGVFKTSKPCKVNREIISLGRYAFYSSFPYPVAYLHPKGVYCYFHPHLILKEDDMKEDIGVSCDEAYEPVLECDNEDFGVTQLLLLARELGKINNLNMASSRTCTTPKAQRIDKIERQIIDGKLTLVDDGGNPLPKVVSTKNVDSDSEVEYVVDDPAVFMASTGLKRGTDSGYVLVKCKVVHYKPPSMVWRNGATIPPSMKNGLACSATSHYELAHHDDMIKFPHRRTWTMGGQYLVLLEGKQKSSGEIFCNTPKMARSGI
ncbi:hypothetical protein Tco_0272763 [Tanacetum coccineum]